MTVKKWDDSTVLELLKNNSDKPYRWFMENSSGVLIWCHYNGGIRYWREKAGFKVRRVFTENYVLKFLKENIDKPASWFGSNDSIIVNWCENNGGWDNWKAKAGVKDKIIWDEASAMEILEKNKKEDFKWFKAYYPRLVQFCLKNGGWRKWAKNAGLVNASKTRNEQTILEDLRKYRGKDINLTWLINNETSLVRWCYRNGGLKFWVAKAGLITK